MTAQIFDTANYILSKCPKISNMKLQKIIYYSHIDYLLKTNTPLIDTNIYPIEAWIYGPVIRELYMEFSKYSYKDITEPSKKGNINNLTTDQINSLDAIIKEYGDLSASDLSDKTHSETPWIEAYQKSRDWSENIITDKKLTSYYKNHPLY